MSDINITVTAQDNIDVEITSNDNINIDLGSTISYFKDLLDTPNTYIGQGLKALRVKETEDGIEFFTGSGLVDWGEISGTLSDQTDLQEAFDLKLNITDFNSHVNDTNNPHEVSLDQILDPDSNTTFALGGNTVTWNFTNPVGGMLFNLTGGWSGHVLEVLDSSNVPNGSAGDHLFHGESDRINVIAGHFVNETAGAIALKASGDSLLDGDVDVNNNSINNLSAIQFNTSYTPTGSEPTGTTYWNSDGLEFVTSVGVKNINDFYESFEFAFDPTADDDDSNTGGNGTFKVSDIWFNNTDGGLWQAEDVTTGSAVWREIVKLNTSGELEGIFILRHDIESVIDGIVLEDGEMAFTDDTNEIRLGDGVTSGGIQAECHYTEGDLNDLSGTGVSNATITIDTGGSTISDFGDDFEYTARIYAYKNVNGIQTFYDYTETNTATYTTGSGSYDVDISWDNIVGADGYVITLKTYIPAFLFEINSYDDGYIDVGDVTEYSLNYFNPATNDPAWIQTTLDASNQSYYSTAIEAKGGFDVTGNGVINWNGVEFIGNNLNAFFGSGNTFALSEDSTAIGTDNSITGWNNKVFGNTNTISSTDDGFNTIIGDNNSINNYTSSPSLAYGISIFGNNNDISSLLNTIVVGDNNFISPQGVSNVFESAIILGNQLTSYEDGIVIGGRINTPNREPNTILLYGHKFGFNVDYPSWNTELNGNTIIEDFESLGANVLTNGNMTTDDWTQAGSVWTKEFSRYNKTSAGTDTLTSPSADLTVGQRYMLYINTDMTVGGITVSAGGWTSPDITHTGTRYAWFTFTATSNTNVVITPDDAMRGIVYDVLIYPFTDGTLTTLGDIFVGGIDGYELSKISADGSASFADGNATIDVDGNILGANLNISNWDTAYGWGDHAIVGYQLEPSEGAFEDGDKTKLDALNIEAQNPTGTILMWSTTSAPTGYLLCDGSAVSRTTYSDLFAVVGTTFGVGDGSTTFNLPDFRDKFAKGKNADAISATGGASTHTHSYSHTHSVSVSIGGSLTSGSTIPATGGSLSPFISGGGGGGTTSQSTSTTGSGNNLPPYLTINFIIKT